ncbi:MAG TPA: lipoyl(octanoyl) transferase LipB [Patescibacteria group bacterium]|nr:lipoyl(octanoyl) transferase LipB [Patescibacteria group bacterium]
MKPCLVVDLGVIAYGRALELQQRVSEARKAGAAPDVLLLCEHPHVITLGRNGRREHLRVSERLLSQMGVEFHPANRGGDITYHGPGQLVGYPIVHVGEIRRDVVWYIRQLENVLIRTSADFGVAARPVAGLTGVWVDAAGHGPEKLAAIGVHFSRWVSTHGFAYNLSTDLRYFDLIVPCGIADRGVTSLERILGRPVDPAEFRAGLTRSFAEVFGFEIEPATLEELEERLECSASFAGAPPARG